ncbi:NAD(P)H-binding protein [Streptomyces sp. NPDC006516]|uniref:SDR family oxidoreductase n=1 Tax=Streptomyces sp. NPDC006516 TaxID=3154309 RepID=UPI0033B925CA
MIVVTGATGNVGKPLVQALAAAGEQVTALSRSVPAAAGAFPAGVRHRPADLTDPASLATAFEGAQALFLLVTGDWMATSGGPGAILGAARSAGIRRIVHLSSQGVATHRHPPALEDAIKRSGLEWTMLRPGGFSSNTFRWAADIRERRAVVAPFGDVALPVVDPADIAEVAALTLLEAGHEGRSYVLTGPEPVTPRQQTAAIGEALGEEVRFVEQSRAEARAQMLRFMPEQVVESTLDILGTPLPEEQRPAADAEKLLGRPARTFATWARRNAAAFA